MGIKAVRIAAEAANGNRALYPHLAALGRIAEYLDAMVQLVHADRNHRDRHDPVGVEAQTILEGTLELGDNPDLQLATEAGEPLNDELFIGYFDVAHGIALLGLIVDSDLDTPFHQLFNHDAKTITELVDGQLGYVVVQITDNDDVPLKAAAVIATGGPDVWQFDAYTLPSTLRDDIIAKAADILGIDL